LLLPQVALDEQGARRTDEGMLGSGIYFAADPSVSSKYSHPSKHTGHRLMLVSEVALGESKDVKILSSLSFFFFFLLSSSSFSKLFVFFQSFLISFVSWQPI
jgi:hypothetical protein